MNLDEKKNLETYDTIAGLLDSYKRYNNCKLLADLVEKINNERPVNDEVSLSTIKKWREGKIPSSDNLHKVFIDKDYYQKALQIVEKLKKQRHKARINNEKLKKEEKQQETVKQSKFTSDDLTFLDYEDLVKVSDVDYPIEPNQNNELAKTFLDYYKAEKNLRAYSESEYARKLDLCKDEEQDIENLLKIIFDERDISTFRYAVSFLTAQYTMIGTKMEFISNFQSRTKYYPYGTNEFIDKKRQTISKLMTTYLEHISNSSTYYGDIYDAVHTYKNWRGLEAMFDDKQGMLPIKEYEKVLKASFPDFDKRFYILQDIPVIKMTLTDIYILCKIAADWNDNRLTKVYGKSDNPDEIDETGFNDADTFNKCPKNIAFWGYKDRCHEYFPSTYESILDRLVEKEEEVNEFFNKRTFFKKTAETGKIYTIRLKIKPMGIEFIKWYEKIFPNPFRYSKQDEIDYVIKIDNMVNPDVSLMKRLSAYSKKGEEVGLCNGVDVPISITDKNYGKKGKANIDNAFITPEKYNTMNMVNKNGHNLLLSKNCSISLNHRETRRFPNALIVGATNVGKTYGFVRQNILAMKDNYIVLDNNGFLYKDLKQMLLNNDYTVKYYRPYDDKEIEPDDKNRVNYNPFAYIQSENDISRLVVSILGEEPSNSVLSEGINKPLWWKIEFNILKAFMTYIWKEDEDKSMHRLMDLICNPKIADEIFTGDKQYYNAYWETKNCLSEKTFKSIMMDLRTYLMPYVIQDIKEDTINIEDFKAKDKQILFIDTGKMLTNQTVKTLLENIFAVLYRYVNDKDMTYHTIPVKFFLDEFDRLPKIECLLEVLQTSPKYNVSINIIIQAISQLQQYYGQNWTNIPLNCDIFLFYATKSMETAEWISNMLGVTTTYSSNKGFIKDQYVMTKNDILKMDADNCIIDIKDVPLVLDEKISTH